MLRFRAARFVVHDADKHGAFRRAQKAQVVWPGMARGMGGKDILLIITIITIIIIVRILVIELIIVIVIIVIRVVIIVIIIVIGVIAEQSLLFDCNRKDQS